MESDQPQLSNAPPEAEKRKPIVLVVDDDRSHRRLFELLAERLEITAHMTASCDEAMEAIKLFTFDAILMDCRMPGVDGFLCTEKIRALKSAQTEVPIIAVTGQTGPQARQKCLDAGMDDYLAKPFTLEQLHAKLARWLPPDTL